MKKFKEIPPTLREKLWHARIDISLALLGFSGFFLTFWLASYRKKAKQQNPVKFEPFIYDDADSKDVN